MLSLACRYMKETGQDVSPLLATGFLNVQSPKTLLKCPQPHRSWVTTNTPSFHHPYFSGPRPIVPYFQVSFALPNRYSLTFDFMGPNAFTLSMKRDGEWQDSPGGLPAFVSFFCQPLRGSPCLSEICHFTAGKKWDPSPEQPASQLFFENGNVSQIRRFIADQPSCRAGLPSLETYSDDGLINMAEWVTSESPPRTIYRLPESGPSFISWDSSGSVDAAEYVVPDRHHRGGHIVLPPTTAALLFPAAHPPHDKTKFYASLSIPLSKAMEIHLQHETGQHPVTAPPSATPAGLSSHNIKANRRLKESSQRGESVLPDSPSAYQIPKPSPRPTPHRSLIDKKAIRD